jgi:hypothetical protein
VDWPNGRSRQKQELPSSHEFATGFGQIGKTLQLTFWSLDDLIQKEQELQHKLSKKQYTAGNIIKRKILALK